MAKPETKSSGFSTKSSISPSVFSFKTLKADGSSTWWTQIASSCSELSLKLALNSV